MAKKSATWRTGYPASAELFDGGHGMKVVLPIVPPSLNVLKKHSGERLTREIRKAVRKWLGDALLAATCETPGLNPQTGRRRVQIVCYRGRELDADNIMGGCKPIVDELVAVGLLRDDGPRFCDLRPPVQVVLRARDQWRTVIYVEALNGKKEVNDGE